MPALPSGCILIWSGSMGNIPSGFLLCNGQLGTPDLRDRFIIGASDTYHPRATGGAASHDHGFTSNGHSHDLTPGADIQTGPDYNDTSTTETDSGTTDPENHLPPYYALAFIIRI